MAALFDMELNEHDCQTGHNDHKEHDFDEDDDAIIIDQQV